jgi:hypothetical protein
MGLMQAMSLTKKKNHEAKREATKESIAKLINENLFSRPKK